MDKQFESWWLENQDRFVSACGECESESTMDKEDARVIWMAGAGIKTEKRIVFGDDVRNMLDIL